MRLRLYPMGKQPQSSPIIVDHFPTLLPTVCNMLPRSTSSVDDLNACLIEEVDELFFVIDPSAKDEVKVNGHLTRLSPLFPGDHISFHDHEFVVSYEPRSRTSARTPRLEDYVLQPIG